MTTNVGLAAIRSRQDTDAEPGSRRPCYLHSWEGNPPPVPLPFGCIISCRLACTFQIRSQTRGRSGGQDVIEVSGEEGWAGGGEPEKKEGDAVWEPFSSNGRGW